MRSLLGGPGGADAATVLRTLVVAAGRGAGGSVWIEARRGGAGAPAKWTGNVARPVWGGELISQMRLTKQATLRFWPARLPNPGQRRPRAGDGLDGGLGGAAGRLVRVRNRRPSGLFSILSTGPQASAAGPLSVPRCAANSCEDPTQLRLCR